MTNKELKAYVFEEKRQGRSESQIARSLNMSLKHLIGKLNGVDVDRIDPPKPKKEEKKPAPKKVEPKPVEVKPEPIVEPVVEEVPVAPVEDLSWME